MKKIYTYFAILMLFFFYTGELQAAIFRVNNSGVNVDFTQPQTAHDAASDGDTIYIEGSATTYDALYLSKKLVIIGPGFFLTENDSTQANTGSAVVYYVSFDSGSAYSVMTGITIGPSGVFIQSSNIMLQRVFSQGMISISVGSNNVTINQSYVNAISIPGQVSDFQLTNSIIYNYNYYLYCLYMGLTVNGTILNNIFRGNLLVQNSIFRNNISEYNGTYEGSSNTMTNNIGASTQYGTLNGNQVNVDMSTVFKYTGSSDGIYKLKEGSPAAGAGYGEVDCGIFGGNNPYVLSGLPTVPAIWELNVNGTSVTVKAKSH